MKKTVICLTMAALAGFLCGCGKEAGNGEAQPKYITVSTNIGGMSKVATGNDGTQIFEPGDELSVYAWTGVSTSAPASGARVVDNAVNRLGSDGKWTATPQMLWKNMVDEHYFIGIYPKSTAPVEDLTNAGYTLNFDDQEASDLLIATELGGKVADNNPVPLTFDHAMAKVIIELSFRNQWDNTSKSVEKVAFRNVASSASVNYLTKAVTPSAARDTELAIPAVETDTRYESIIIPQDGINTVVVTVKSEGVSKDYPYTHKSDFNFASGKVTTIRLIVGRNQIDLGEVKINNWLDGETIDGGEALD